MRKDKRSEVFIVGSRQIQRMAGLLDTDDFATVVADDLYDVFEEAFQEEFAENHDYDAMTEELYYKDLWVFFHKVMRAMRQKIEGLQGGSE